MKMKKERQFLSPMAYRLSPKKSLGQHFLTSAHYLKLIADAAQLKKGEAVLEIGPGKGALTRELLARSARVVAVEKDARLLPVLAETFAPEIASGQLKLVEMDALEFDPSAYGLSPSHYKLIANIPYYITGALLRKFLGRESRPSSLVLLIQKEVAERIARSKKESLLSLSVKAYGEPHYIKTVPRGAFAPAPAVDSAILAISGISGARFKSKAHEALFFELIHAGFSSKRKLARRNLEKVLGNGAGEALARAEIPPNARAEDIPLASWIQLASGM